MFLEQRTLRTCLADTKESTKGATKAPKVRTVRSEQISDGTSSIETLLDVKERGWLIEHIALGCQLTNAFRTNVD